VKKERRSTPWVSCTVERRLRGQNMSDSHCAPLFIRGAILCVYQVTILLVPLLLRIHDAVYMYILREYSSVKVQYCKAQDIITFGVVLRFMLHDHIRYKQQITS
jgi:hypothetical protein